MATSILYPLLEDVQGIDVHLHHGKTSHPPYKKIGNAVPPLLSYLIAHKVNELIETHCAHFEDTKIMFCGDVAQTDLIRTNEKNGILDFQKIITRMSEFEQVEFGVDDIVRSGLVKSYITSKIELGM